MSYRHRIESPYRVPAGARMLGICEATLRRWIKSGLVEAVRVNNTLLISAAEIRRLSGARPAVPDFKMMSAGDCGE